MSFYYVPNNTSGFEFYQAIGNSVAPNAEPVAWVGRRKGYSTVDVALSSPLSVMTDVEVMDLASALVRAVHG